MSQYTPDAWIERQDVDYGPQDEDRCPVCHRIDCDCQADDDSEEQSPEAIYAMCGITTTVQQLPRSTRVFSSHAQDRLPSIRKLKEAVANGGAQ